MSANFLHGIESIEVNIGPQPVTVVKSAVIGLVGTAPIWSGPTPPDAVSRPRWSASTLYFVGSTVIDDASFIQQVTIAGTSDSGAPSFNGTIGETTTDGGVTWKNIGPFLGKAIPAWNAASATPWPLWNQDALYALNDCVIDANGNLQQVYSGSSDFYSGDAVPADGVGAGPDWNTQLGSTTSDNHLTWKLIVLAQDLQYTNVLRLVNGIGDAPFFGRQVQGYTIPYAIQAIQLQGAGQIIAVNVFDQVQHRTPVGPVDLPLPGSGLPQVLNLGNMGVSLVKVTDTSDAVLILGVDFSLDPVNGLIKVIDGGSITTGQTLRVRYMYADTSIVTTSMVIGTELTDGDPPATGQFAGLQLLPLSMSLFGFNPKIIIAPTFSQALDVEAAITALVPRIKAIAYIATDLNDGATPGVQDALANRGVTDPPKAFNVSDVRLGLCYPRGQFIDDGVSPVGNPVVNPSVTDYTAWVAGATAAKDLAKGYWYSVSNTILNGLLGPDIHITMSAFDATSDTNQLNAAGIITMFSSFGTGLRVWGNRSSAYPASTTPDVFMCIRRTLDIIEESLELFTLQFLDGPITNGLISSILQSANSFVRLQIQRGALEPGSAVTYDVTQNPSVQLAAGQLVFTINCMPPPPAERITYQVQIDTSLLSGLTGQ